MVQGEEGSPHECMAIYVWGPSDWDGSGDEYPAVPVKNVRWSAVGDSAGVIWEASQHLLSLSILIGGASSLKSHVPDAVV